MSGREGRELRPRGVVRLRGNRLLRTNEEATSAIVAGHVRWCRAKVLHALAGAASQGVLEEVLSELVPEDESLPARVVRALRETGWMAREE